MYFDVTAEQVAETKLFSGPSPTTGTGTTVEQPYDSVLITYLADTDQALIDDVHSCIRRW